MPSIGLIFEVCYVWFAVFLVFNLAIFYRTHLSIFRLDPKNDFITKVVDVAAVFTAYALTVVTILPALNEKIALQRLQKGGLYRLFTSYIGTALYSNAWLIVYGLTLKLLFERLSAKTGAIPAFLSALWWGSCSAALLSLFRASRLLLKVVASR